MPGTSKNSKKIAPSKINVEENVEKNIEENEEKNEEESEEENEEDKVKNNINMSAKQKLVFDEFNILIDKHFPGVFDNNIKNFKETYGIVKESFDTLCAIETSLRERQILYIKNLAEIQVLHQFVKQFNEQRYRQKAIATWIRPG